MSGRLIIDLLRHGACADGDIYRGRTDSPLSALGRRQLAATVKGLVDQPPYQALYSSPLQRCRLPAQQLAEQLALPLRLDSRLQELDFGEWDGQPCQQVWQQQQSRVLAFWADPVANPPPGGESLVSFQQRLGRLLQHWLGESVESNGVADDGAGSADRRILCLTHAGVIRALVCQLLGVSLSAGQSLSLDYASLSRIELYPDLSNGGGSYHSQLIFFNRLSEISRYC